MQDTRMQNQISILRCPKFWQFKNSRSNSLEGDVQYERKWDYLYKDECKICKKKNLDVNECKHRSACKLFVIKAEEGEILVKRLNKNAKLPVRGMARAAGYDLAAAESAVLAVHSKRLVKTGLAIAIPPDCYGRIAPRSGLAVKRFIDVGAGVIDSDYRGELGVVLFNFGNEEFIVNMGDKIAQLIFERIRTLVIKETN